NYGPGSHWVGDNASRGGPTASAAAASVRSRTCARRAYQALRASPSSRIVRVQRVASFNEALAPLGFATMRAQAFVDALPSLWDGDPASADHPCDRRFRTLLEDLGGMATENKLALLNLAASFLEPDEVYLEIGTYLGTSVVAAALGNDGAFIAVDNYSQF